MKFRDFVFFAGYGKFCFKLYLYIIYIMKNYNKK